MRLIIQPNSDKARQKRITEILAEGVYAYLKTSGLLKEDMERTEKIKRVVGEAKKAGNAWQEEIEGESS